MPPSTQQKVESNIERCRRTTCTLYLPCIWNGTHVCVVCQILEPCTQLSSHNISFIGIFPPETAQPVVSITRNTTDIFNPTEWSQGSKLLDSAILARQTMYLLQTIVYYPAFLTTLHPPPRTMMATTRATIREPPVNRMTNKHARRHPVSPPPLPTKEHSNWQPCHLRLEDLVSVGPPRLLFRVRPKEVRVQRLVVDDAVWPLSGRTGSDRNRLRVMVVVTMV